MNLLSIYYINKILRDKNLSGRINFNEGNPEKTSKFLIKSLCPPHMSHKPQFLPKQISPTQTIIGKGKNREER